VGVGYCCAGTGNLHAAALKRELLGTTEETGRYAPEEDRYDDPD
jgi:hypothetical protein